MKANLDICFKCPHYHNDLNRDMCGCAWLNEDFTLLTRRKKNTLDMELNPHFKVPDGCPYLLELTLIEDQPK